MAVIEHGLRLRLSQIATPKTGKITQCDGCATRFKINFSISGSSLVKFNLRFPRATMSSLFLFLVIR